MHYAQYLVMTLKVYSAKQVKQNAKTTVLSQVSHTRSYLLLIGVYGGIATFLAIFSQKSADIFGALIIIPILVQMLHFYLDGLLVS